MSKAKDYNLVKWDDYFYVDSSSPSGLSWKIPRYFNGTPNYERVGKPVGSITKTKNQEYWSVGLSDNRVRSTYLLHRIIWVMCNGSVGEHNDVDHIDGDGLNNNISNLRECSKSINSRNSKKRIDNKTGRTSVFYEKTNTSEGYRACVIGLDGIKYRKFFSVIKFGENALNLAEGWRKAKLEELENAGFTERHGE